MRDRMRFEILVPPSGLIEFEIAYFHPDLNSVKKKFAASVQNVWRAGTATERLVGRLADK